MKSNSGAGATVSPRLEYELMAIVGLCCAIGGILFAVPYTLDFWVL